MTGTTTGPVRRVFHAVERFGQLVEAALVRLGRAVGRLARPLGTVLRPVLRAVGAGLRALGRRVLALSFVAAALGWLRERCPWPGRLPRVGPVGGGPPGQEVAQRPHPSEAASGPAGATGPATAGAPAPRARRPLCLGIAAYLLGTATLALWTILVRVDSALSRMGTAEHPGGSALGFPGSLGTLADAIRVDRATAQLADVRAGWAGYAANAERTGVLRNPLDVAGSLVTLDLLFIAGYALLLLLGLRGLILANASAPGISPTERFRLDRMLRWTVGTLVALVAADLVEDLALWFAVHQGVLLRIGDLVAVGPLATVAKKLLTVAVLVPAGLAALVLLLNNRSLRRAALSARAVLVGVAALAALLSVGIGADQVDDVIRAWDGWRGAASLVALGLLAGTLCGVVRHLTGTALEYPAPDTGHSAQAFTLGAGILVVLAGQLGRLVGLGWGLTVPGVLLIGIWALGLPFTGLGGSAGDEARVSARDVAERDDRDVAADEIAVWGDRIGRASAAALATLMAVVIARATALDAYLRTSSEGLAAAVVTAVLMTLVGAGLLAWRPVLRRGQPAWRAGWAATTLGTGLAAVVLFQGAYAVWLPQRLGAVAVLLGGFTLFIGAGGGLASAVRRGPFPEYALAPALRVLRLRRFPVAAFLLLWVLGVSVLDPGGYHDIRRDARPAADPAPTLADAWSQFTARPADVRPVVLVAAEGGGIRAAVWTSLVMECLFGPGPVPESGAPCAEPSATPDRAAMAARLASSRLPVFLASGASGGSVGLAAWSARRTDLLQDGAASTTPLRVEQAFDSDFVAPDVARLILADLPHAFLAWGPADRAVILERAWEQEWQLGDRSPSDPAARGLSRGLRQTWDLTHRGPDGWTTPVLALNGVSVEDGCRMLVSPVDFSLPVGAARSSSTADRPTDASCRGPLVTTSADGYAETGAADLLPSTSELIDYLCPGQDIPMSTAAHLSARFPFVSPSGRILRDRSCAAATPGLVPPDSVSYDADGGFFDNSGAGTVVDTWRALAPVAARAERLTGSCIVPIMVQIDNTPAARTDMTGPDPTPLEVLAPLTTTLGQVGSREAYARSSAAATFARPLSAGGREVRVAAGPAVERLWFRITLPGQPGPQPPLGWALSQETVSDMRAQLMARDNVAALTQLRALLDGTGPSCGP